VSGPDEGIGFFSRRGAQSARIGIDLDNAKALVAAVHFDVGEWR